MSRHLCYALLLLLSSCGTMFNDIDQYVCVNSSPTYATLYADGVMIGKTPITVNLLRRCNHTLRIELDGYQPYEVCIGRDISCWAYGDSLCSGPFGVVFDAYTGGVYRLTPRQVHAQLNALPLQKEKEEGITFISVVLSSDPAWEKIASLEPLTP